MITRARILATFIVIVITYLSFNYVNLIGPYPIKTITLKGMFVYVDENKLRRNLAPLMGQDLMDMDIMDIKKSVEKNDWIKNALVKRKFPNTLFIEIFEYNPILFWNDESYIDDEGENLTVKKNISIDLPHIKSSTNNYKKMYDLYIDLSELLKKIGLKILSISHTGDMLRISTDKYDFLLRYSSYYQKIDEFINVYEQFQNLHKKNIRIIDLRYSTGFAVH